MLSKSFKEKGAKQSGVYPSVRLASRNCCSGMDDRTNAMCFTQRPVARCQRVSETEMQSIYQPKNVKRQIIIMILLK